MSQTCLCVAKLSEIHPMYLPTCRFFYLTILLDLYFLTSFKEFASIKKKRNMPIRRRIL